MITPKMLTRMLLAATGFIAVTGCGDPIYDSNPWRPSSTALATNTSEVDASSEKYQWPLVGTGYVIAKPVPMAYVTAFDEKLQVPDRTTAETVPWSSEGLSDQAKRYLEDAFATHSSEFTPTVTLDPKSFVGPQAFDVSVDGTRMIVIDDQGLAMYRTDDGKLLGHRDLPPAFQSGANAAKAIRFCGTSKDMLVASDALIVRISSKDGSEIGRCDGIGEPIIHWQVTDDDESMMMLGESGKMHGGDPQLTSVEAYHVGQRITLRAASLSPDGKRIATVVDSKPRIYLLKNHRIVDQIDPPKNVQLDPNISIACGHNSDAWSDGDGIAYHVTDRDEPDNLYAYRMNWKPIQISMMKQADDYFSPLICVAHRIVDGRKQVILFSHYAYGRGHSLPIVLPEVPIRFSHSRAGDVVAVCDGRGISVGPRHPFAPTSPIFTKQLVVKSMNDADFDSIDRMMAIIKTQSRFCFRRTPEELRSALIDAIANRWNASEGSDEEAAKEELVRFQKWLDDGSETAIAANGLRLYRLAWQERQKTESGRGGQSNWDSYKQKCVEARDALKKICDGPSPPLQALDTLIQTTLETNGKLEDVDVYCEKACRLYPGEATPHRALSFKLLPQWFGEPGTALSLAPAVANLHERPVSDLLYTKLTAYLVFNIQSGDPASWRSYDPIRISRGIDEWIRCNELASDDLWNLWLYLVFNHSDPETANRLLNYLLETDSAPPSQYTGARFAQHLSTIDAAVTAAHQTAK
ncbi:hypothetical protein Poly51_57730 [Rubripirellula tenax]|uniref:Uncharacterized protein n=1 Tax=Rubripirellula tenax TaxID=2528015 RepID=A0A5C6EEF8_9BACT|nr:hypothetical protein [Rubripirellula tenax]TWU46377.1 hypothetical protein Poly51_57730 [Rubripirellula tenax]